MAGGPSPGHPLEPPQDASFPLLGLRYLFKRSKNFLGLGDGGAAASKYAHAVAPIKLRHMRLASVSVPSGTCTSTGNLRKISCESYLRHACADVSLGLVITSEKYILQRLSYTTLPFTQYLLRQK